MNRRGMLGTFLGLPALAFSKSREEQLLDRVIGFPDGERFPCGRWEVLWTGWKSAYGNVELIGQWVALPRKPWRTLGSQMYGLYASVHGGEGVFWRGDCFNTDLRQDQRPVILGITSVREQEEEKRKGLKRLLALIRQHPDPTAPVR